MSDEQKKSRVGQGMKARGEQAKGIGGGGAPEQASADAGQDAVPGSPIVYPSEVAQTPPTLDEKAAEELASEAEERNRLHEMLAKTSPEAVIQAQMSVEVKPIHFIPLVPVYLESGDVVVPVTLRETQFHVIQSFAEANGQTVAEWVSEQWEKMFEQYCEPAREA